MVLHFHPIDDFEQCPVLLVHVPITYSLLILAVLHLVVVYAFGGGVS